MINGPGAFFCPLLKKYRPCIFSLTDKMIVREMTALIVVDAGISAAQSYFYSIISKSVAKFVYPFFVQRRSGYHNQVTGHVPVQVRDVFIA